MPIVIPTQEVYEQNGQYGWRLRTPAGDVAAESAQRFATASEAEQDAARVRTVISVVAPDEPAGGAVEPDWSKGLLGVAAALVIGVLAALGVSGDLLARMVRNSPDDVARPLTVMLVVGGLIGCFAIVRTKAATSVKVIGIVATFVVVCSLVKVADVAKASQEKRERPSVHLELTRDDKGNLSLTGGASATSLKSNENLLLQVIQLDEPVATYAELRGVCTDAVNVLQPGTDAYGGDNIRVLSWAEVGPDSKGAAMTQMAVPSELRSRLIPRFARWRS